MTWSLTLAWLPRAGANSNPHNYKQRWQKLEELPKIWVSTWKPFDFRRKKNKLLAWPNISVEHTAHENKNEFGPCKQWELNRTKLERKASDQLCWNFARLEQRSQVPTCSTFMKSWLVMTWSLTLAGLPRKGASLKPHNYKQKWQKMKDLPKIWASTWKPFDFRQKK